MLETDRGVEIKCRYCKKDFRKDEGPIRYSQQGVKRTLAFCSRECYNKHIRQYKENQKPFYEAWIQQRKKSKQLGQPLPSYEKFIEGREEGIYGQRQVDSEGRVIQLNSDSWLRGKKKLTADTEAKHVNRLIEYKEKYGVWPTMSDISREFKVSKRYTRCVYRKLHEREKVVRERIGYEYISRVRPKGSPVD